MLVVADSSALIHSAKDTRFIKILKQLIKKIYIPPAVYEESFLKELGKHDVITLERLLEEDFIVIVNLTEKAESVKERLEDTGLGKGEIEPFH
ncbi:MAG: hypothetical protein ACE5K4_12800 [Candidatus Hydrothermarchaeota archaeon]